MSKIRKGKEELFGYKRLIQYIDRILFELEIDDHRLVVDLC